MYGKVNLILCILVYYRASTSVNTITVTSYLQPLDLPERLVLRAARVYILEDKFNAVIDTRSGKFNDVVEGWPPIIEVV